MWLSFTLLASSALGFLNKAIAKYNMCFIVNVKCMQQSNVLKSYLLSICLALELMAALLWMTCPRGRTWWKSSVPIIDLNQYVLISPQRAKWGKTESLLGKDDLKGTQSKAAFHTSPDFAGHVLWTTLRLQRWSASRIRFRSGPLAHTVTSWREKPGAGQTSSWTQW